MHISQPVDGGTATVLEQLAVADLERGREVTIASPPGRLQQWAVAHEVSWVDLPLVREPSVKDLSAIYRVRRLLPSVDVIYLHSSKAGAVGRLAMASLTRARRPVCVFSPHAWSWYVGGCAAPVYRLFERIATRWADAVVVVSRGEERDGRATLFPAGSKKLVLIENGVDTDVHTPEGPVAPSTAGPLVVCVGRLCEQKGQDLLIRAVSNLEDRSVNLRFVGDGPEASGLRSLAEGAEVSDRVHFTGQVDPRPHFRAADVVVVPSRWEGRSLVLLEAMACGAPVIATPQAAADFHGDEGIVTTKGSEPADLARTLDSLLGDPQLREDLGRRARAAIELDYSLQRVAGEYHSLIESLVPGASSGPPLDALSARC